MKNNLYSKSINELAPWVKWIPMHREWHEIISSYISKEYWNDTKIKILDIGSWNGATILSIAKETKSAIFDALDLEWNHKLWLLKDNININELNGSIENFQLRKNNYDIITASFSLHHVWSKNREKTYKKIYNSLKNNWLFCFFDVMEVSPEVENAFMNYYINNSWLDINLAKKRYLSLVGLEMLTQCNVESYIKDKYEDKHLKIEEYKKLILNAWFKIDKIIFFDQYWIECKKLFIIFAKK